MMNEDAADNQLAAGDGFVAFEALQKALRFWWFVSLLVVAGGVAGWLIHSTRPPVYEAVARFSASIDYVSTGPMSQQAEDIALNAIGKLLYDNKVVQKVVDQASAEGISTSVADLKHNSVLERKVSVWDLRVRSTDPLRAETLTNLWVEQGQAALLSSYQHALKAAQIERYLQSLESCLAQSAASEPVNVQCSQTRFAEIQADIDLAGKSLAQERIASGGLFSGLVIGPIDRAVVSAQPVLFGQNLLVLAGGLIGLVIGVWLVQINFPARWIKRN